MVHAPSRGPEGLGSGVHGVSMAKDERPSPLKDLETRLRKAREGVHSAGHDRPFATGFGQAMSLVVEMVAGVAAGALLGWLLDSWLGTEPWLLVVFIFVGMGAGLLNAYRRAQRFGAGAKPNNSPREGDGPSEDA